MPLTDAQIRKIKSSDKTQRFFDGNGMYLEVSPKGGKWWRLKYRFRGKEKRISLGTYPDISLKQAREKKEDARRLLANNIDPSEHRKSNKQITLKESSNTFEAIAREWFKHQAPTWAPTHADRVISRLERDIFPWLGSLSISEISAPEILSSLRRIEDRGALETAHRTLGTCGQVFRYAVATGRAQRDPTGDLKGALAPVKGDHFAAVTNPEKVGEILRALEGYSGTLVVKCALKLAPLVFVRPGELRTARWEDIEFEKNEWRYFVNKTKTQHIVPLSKQATKVFKELLPLTGGGIYVFPSARSRSGDQPMSDNAILSALRRLDISKEEMSGHGFRAMARTILDEELGFRPDLIEHQLAHAVRDPHGRAYNRTAHLPQRHQMMQRWADYLEELKTKSTRMN